MRGQGEDFGGGEEAGRPSAWGLQRDHCKNLAWLPRLAAVTVVLVLAAALVAAPFSDVLAKRRSQSRAHRPAIAAAIVVDMNTGKVLHAKGADTLRHPASLTKIMTLYMLFSYLRSGAITLQSELLVTAHASRQAPTKLGLKPGSTIRTEDAINALVTQSANDVAVVIAENLAGTEENFAKAMTQKARSLGMTNTVFRNASGLPSTEQVTTARDMAILGRQIIVDFPEYYECFKTKYFRYRGKRYRNHNKLLFGYKGTDGIKTGYTRAAGFNLTVSVQRGDKHLIGVVLGGRTGAQRNAAMRALLDRHFPKASKSKQKLIAFAAQPAPPPPDRKPVLASVAPSPDIGQGSFGGQSANPNPAQADPIVTGGRGGKYHVQVGAYTSQAQAENQLAQVQGRAGKLFEGYAPITPSIRKNQTHWYRARFAGFTQDKAKTACAKLKRMSVDCIVMRAQ